MKAVAMVTAAVLVVIGIGVATVSGLTPRHLYGTGRLSFWASFPDSFAVSVSPSDSCTGGASVLGHHGLVHMAVVGNVDGSGRSPKPNSGPVAMVLPCGYLQHVAARFSRQGCSRGGVGMGGTIYLCTELVTSPGVTWLVMATSPHPAQARAFINSFSPASG